jgi:hypothetical protein
LAGAAAFFTGFLAGAFFATDFFAAGFFAAAFLAGFFAVFLVAFRAWFLGVRG